MLSCNMKEAKVPCRTFLQMKRRGQRREERAKSHLVLSFYRNRRLSYQSSPTKWSIRSWNISTSGCSAASLRRSLPSFAPHSPPLSFSPLHSPPHSRFESCIHSPLLLPDADCLPESGLHRGAASALSLLLVLISRSLLPGTIIALLTTLSLSFESNLWAHATERERE